jgi:hypothetical protein
MTTASRTDIDEVLTYVAESLDISPTDYERAVRSYGAVGKWLEDGFDSGAYPESSGPPAIYPQGSINLGTVVRPLRDGKESDFDVDLVCELNASSEAITPRGTKREVGDRLKDNDTYRDKLEPEGKRCWTLTYAESEGIGFHIDVLPCVPCPADNHPRYPGAISITNKDKVAATYTWKAGNPKGYGQWFHEHNPYSKEIALHQKKSIFERHASSGGMLKYASIDAVPEQLVRTPLQRVVQLMKRHRDIRFAKTPKYKPISIIITTLAAQLYEGETEVYATLRGIVERLAMHGDLLADIYASLNEKVAAMQLITRSTDGEWHIPNPVNDKENFADRWHEDNDARARAFFQWVQWLQEDIDSILNADNATGVDKELKRVFGARAASGVAKQLPPSPASTSLVERIGTAALSLFSVPWRQKPDWPMRARHEFDLDARLSKHNGFTPYGYQYRSGSKRLDKRLSIHFTAPSFGDGCDYYWQVINTGDEARWQSDLRGGFQVDDRIHTETTKYRGDHCVQCFVVKNGVCIARSHEFVVRIK